MNTHSRNIGGAALLIATLASAQVTASWVPVTDLDSTDVWSNPGHPRNQSPATVGSYLQHLLNLADAPTLRRQNDYHGGVLSGLGNPATPDAFLLALHFGDGNDAWAHDGPFDVFFSCVSDCDSFALQNTHGLGNYRLYATGTDQNAAAVLADPEIAVTEPGSIALIGLGCLALGLVVAHRRKQEPDHPASRTRA